MRQYFLTGSLLVLLLNAWGQDQHDVQPPALAMHFVWNDFVPVSTRQGPSFHETKAGLAASYIKGLDRRMDLMIGLAGSIVRFPFRRDQDMKEDGQQLLLLEGDVSIRCKLLAYYHWISPYSRIGLGLSAYQGKIGLFAPLGLGTQLNLNPFTFLLLDAQYRLAMTPTQTGHFFYSLGLGGIIHQRRSPVVRKTVHPPVLPAHDVAAGATVGDSDGDGIPDDQDKCPFAAGWAVYDGCPPPAVPGKDKAHGADTAWSIADRLYGAAQRVYFATGKYVLLPASYPALDEVAAMLKEYPSLQIEIQGHTDNVGSGDDNQLLSQRRAEAVMSYLSGKGVPGRRRLQARGYGSTRPIATNTTEEGRALNRRVEFKIVND